MNGVHMKPVWRVRRHPQLDRVDLAACLPYVHFKWRVSNGGVPGVLCRVALVAAVAIPHERPTRGEAKGALPPLESSLPAADRDRTAVKLRTIQAHANRDHGRTVALCVPHPHRVVQL